VRASIRFPAIFLASLVMVMSAVSSYADSVDPHVIITDPNTCTGSLCSVGNSFSFGIPGNTTVTIGSSPENNNWYQLLISWNPSKNGLQVQNVTGGVGKTGNVSFWDWTRVFNSPTDVGILFFSAKPDTDPNSPFFGQLPPITPGSIFSLHFTPGGGNWPATDFRGQANTGGSTVPEPSSIVLLLSGIAGIASRRRSWLRAA
jgi:hypothetical protein